MHLTNDPAALRDERYSERGWFYFLVSRGGLEVWNPIVDFLSVRNNLKEQPNTFFALIEDDVNEYAKLFAA